MDIQELSLEEGTEERILTLTPIYLLDLQEDHLVDFVVVDISSRHNLIPYFLDILRTW